MVEEKNHVAFYSFLDTLDCYLTRNQQLKEEVQRFSDDKNREIAAFVTRRTTESIDTRRGFFRMVYVLEGSISLQVGEEEWTVTKGSLLIATFSATVSYEGSIDSKVVVFYFKTDYFTESLLSQFVEETFLYRFFVEGLSAEASGAARYLLYDFKTAQDLHSYVLLLLKQIVKMRYFNNKVTKAAFVLLVVEIAQESKGHLIAKDTQFLANQRMEEVLTYMDQRLATITLDELAGVFHFHPNYLSFLLKEKTHKTFTQLVLYKRVDRCKNYLAQTNLPVQTIVEKLGYKDKAFFYKRFKQIEGMTPRQYRTHVRRERDV